MAGRKPFSPTAEQRKIVHAMAGYGVPQDDVAIVIGCAPKTLRRAFRAELNKAMIEANAKVAERLFRMTAKETGPGVAAMIFWMKTRGGWSEKNSPIDLNVHQDNRTDDEARADLDRKFDRLAKRLPRQKG